MANQYSADVPKGFNVPKQVRLDSITGVQNELTLKDLGSSNNLAFKYYEGLKVYCKDEKTEYVWREVIGVETGLLDVAFTYPTYSPIDGINYSGKSFNFFEITNSNITPPDGSETKLNSGSDISITGSGTISNPYIINSISNAGSVYINPGDNVEIIGNGTVENPYVISSVDTNTTYLAGAGLVLSGTTFNIENLQKVITYPTDFIGTNYTLTNVDNNYEIIVDNGITAVTITVPSGLISKIGVGFTQKGTGDVSYTASGTTINNPVGLKIKGQFYQTYLSQELSTNNYFLGGNTKI